MSRLAEDHGESTAWPPGTLTLEDRKLTISRKNPIQQESFVQFLFVFLFFVCWTFASY